MWRPTELVRHLKRKLLPRALDFDICPKCGDVLAHLDGHVYCCNAECLYER